MRNIIEIAKENNITNGKNSILNRSMENELKEDKVFLSITKEITEFVVKMLNKNKLRK